ncbi:MAG TPA: zinc-binding alcohol dehydrogenase family protein [Streptosporangiaceae bacterium]|nr:zinc-binding alcohol dehydrogenase family protein [Streptosporangiaceae bacterium]
MKAAVLRSPDGTPECADFDEPPVPSGRELVGLAAAGIHPVVRSLAANRHYGSTGTYPLIPGVDAVARTADGTLVYTGYVQPPYGTLAERMAVPAAMKLPIPDGAEPERVAGGLNPGLSSWLPLRNRQSEAGALGTVLILGATGMAGLLAVQNARLLGADRVIAAGRDRDRLARAEAYGATTVPLPARDAAAPPGARDVTAAALADALGGTAPGLVLDFVWGAPAEAAFAALARRGLEEDDADIAYVQIGALAGGEAAVPSALLRSRRIRISGSGAGSASIDTIMAELPGYIEMIANGSVEVPVRVFALSAVSQAWAAAGSGGERVVVVPG